MKSFYLLLLLLPLGCGKEAAPELHQAAAVLESFINPFTLQNSMFAAAYPESKPRSL